MSRREPVVDLDRRKGRGMKLKDALKPFLTEEERALMVGSFDIVGDIAIIIVAPELTAKENLIADAIFQTHKHVKTVAKRAGNYDGEFRTIALEVIGGRPLGETEQKENGVRLFLDPGKAYYSVRSSNERKRIAGLITPGEEVLVMFSGVGVFPLVIAAHSAASEVTGVEKNPDAHCFAKKSLAANKRIKNVTLYKGDVVEVLPRLNRTFDRVLMPLPSTAEDFLGLALKVVRPGGHLHFYDFQALSDLSQSVAKVQRACSDNGRSLLDCKAVVCGHVSPRNHRICVDAIIQ